MFLQQPGDSQKQLPPFETVSRRKFCVLKDCILSLLSLEAEKIHLTLLSPTKDTGDSFTLTWTNNSALLCVGRAFGLQGLSADFKTLFVGWECKSWCGSSSEIFRKGPHGKNINLQKGLKVPSQRQEFCGALKESRSSHCGSLVLNRLSDWNPFKAPDCFYWSWGFLPRSGSCCMKYLSFVK